MQLPGSVVFSPNPSSNKSCWRWWSLPGTALAKTALTGSFFFVGWFSLSHQMETRSYLTGTAIERLSRRKFLSPAIPLRCSLPVDLSPSSDCRSKLHRKR
ncbi:hypothetical protein LXL04_002714 [Taraxacum kok-saghyz]